MKIQINVTFLCMALVCLVSVMLLTQTRSVAAGSADGHCKELSKCGGDEKRVVVDSGAQPSAQLMSAEDIKWIIKLRLIILISITLNCAMQTANRSYKSFCISQGKLLMYFAIKTFDNKA